MPCATLAAAGIAAAAVLAARRVGPGEIPRCRIAAGNGTADASGNAGKEGEAEAPNVAPEELVEELHSKMHELAKAEDYKAAGVVRDQLYQLRVEDEVKVLAVNTELYKAFTARDLARMKALWLEAPGVHCIHPYEKRHTGYSDVLSCWQRLFEAASSGANAVSAENVRVTVHGSTAMIVCREQVSSVKKLRTVRTMQATNVFRKVGSSWLLVHRHVSTPLDTFSGAGASRTPHGRESDLDTYDNILKAAGDQVEDVETLLAAASEEAQGISRHLRRMLERLEDDAAVSSEEEMGDGGLARPSAKGFEEVERFHFEEDPDVSSDEDVSDGDSCSSGSSIEDYDEDDHHHLEEVISHIFRKIRRIDRALRSKRKEKETSRMQVARETVRALRRLSQEGRLSDEARVKLLSEVSRNPGDSMPDRAFNLLLRDVPEEEMKAAWDDFAALIEAEVKSTAAPPENATAEQGQVAGEPKHPKERKARERRSLRTDTE